MDLIQPISPQQEQHLLPLAQLVAQVFTGGKYVDQICDTYLGNCHYDWQTSRILLEGEQIIHHWGVWGYPMRLESVQLKVAGVGAVATHPDFRQQGWMHSAAQASFEAMAQAGYDLSILRGRHYVRMGYARAWNYVTYRLKLEELPRLDAPPAYQSLQPEQIGIMDALYNQSHAAFSGSAVRPTYRGRTFEDLGVQVWYDAQGALAGYVRALPAEDNPKILQCLEAAGDPAQGLAVLADLYKQAEYESLAFFTLPHHHPLLQLLRKGTCIVENRYFDVSGWRVRLVNLESTLQKQLPLFEERLASSRFAGWQGFLGLDAGAHKATLQIERSQVSLVPTPAPEHNMLGGAAIARLLIGSDDPDEVIRQEGIVCQGLAQELARVLFPHLHPMLSHWDEI